MLDMFDVRVKVPPVPLSEMMGSEKCEASAIIAARVGAAREMQMARQNCLNAHLDGKALYTLAAPDTAGQSLLDRIADTKKLNARGLTAFCVLPARWPISTIEISRLRRTSPPQYASAMSLFSMLAGGVRIML